MVRVDPFLKCHFQNFALGEYLVNIRYASSEATLIRPYMRISGDLSHGNWYRSHLESSRRVCNRPTIFCKEVDTLQLVCSSLTYFNSSTGKQSSSDALLLS